MRVARLSSVLRRPSSVARTSRVGRRALAKTSVSSPAMRGTPQSTFTRIDRSPASPMRPPSLAAPNILPANQCSLTVPCETPTGPINVGVDYFAPAAALNVEAGVKAAIQKIAPAAVFIRAYTGNNLSGWSGSGVIVDPAVISPHLKATLPPNTYVALTNHHVAYGDGNAKALVVRLADGTELPAKILRSPRNRARAIDTPADIAALLIHSDRPLATATIGDASQLEQGDFVITAGHPFGLPKLSVTRGMVSQPKQYTGDRAFPVIQTEAAINPGNSGGALVNMRGEVVGLNTFIFRNANNVGFAIPIQEQLRALRDIYTTGDHPRSTFGITWGNFPHYLRQQQGFPLDHGALVKAIDAGWISRLFLSIIGLRAGDVVTGIRVADQPSHRVAINNPFEVGQLLSWIEKLPANQLVYFTSYRPTTVDGKTTWEKRIVPYFTHTLDDKSGRLQGIPNDEPVAALEHGARTFLRAA